MAKFKYAHDTTSFLKFSSGITSSVVILEVPLRVHDLPDRIFACNRLRRSDIYSEYI